MADILSLIENREIYFLSFVKSNYIKWICDTKRKYSYWHYFHVNQILRRQYNSLAMSLCSDNLCQIWVLTSWVCDILCVSYVCIMLIHIASCNSRLSKNHGIKRSFSDCSLLLINKNYTTPYFLFFYI